MPLFPVQIKINDINNLGALRDLLITDVDINDEPVKSVCIKPEFKHYAVIQSQLQRVGISCLYLIIEQIAPPIYVKSTWRVYVFQAVLDVDLIAWVCAMEQMRPEMPTIH